MTELDKKIVLNKSKSYEIKMKNQMLQTYKIEIDFEKI